MRRLGSQIERDLQASRAYGDHNIERRFTASVADRRSLRTSTTVETFYTAFSVIMVPVEESELSLCLPNPSHEGLFETVDASPDDDPEIKKPACVGAGPTDQVKNSSETIELGSHASRLTHIGEQTSLTSVPLPIWSSFVKYPEIKKPACVGAGSTDQSDNSSETVELGSNASPSTPIGEQTSLTSVPLPIWSSFVTLPTPPGSTVQPRTCPPGTPVLFICASLFEFSIDKTRRKAGYPYLSYVQGDVFDVVSQKGELWLAKNQDDSSNVLGWIWEDHFVVLSQG